MGIFECRQCKESRKIPRRYTYYLSKAVRCPLCGTYRLRALLEPDRIDRMHNNPMTVLHRIIGDCRLYHCRYCRIQFYDRRALADQEVVNGSATRS